MKLFLAIGGAALALLALDPSRAVAQGQQPLAIGSTSPKTGVKMKNVDGREFSISDVAGPKGTLVMFSCNACPWVKAWETRIAALGNTYRQKGVGIIAINSNDPKVQSEDSFEVMQKRAQERGFQFPYVVDATSDVARAFGASRTPEAFLFDASGKLVYHGAIDDNAKAPDQVESHYLKDALEAVIGGRKVAVRETKSIGCTIKFRT
jgi:peroxiredoxin